MYRSKYTFRKKKRFHYKKIFICLLFISILVISFLSLNFFKQKETITLVHTWQSDETGQILTFTKDGSVTFKNNLPTGTYRIISPNTLEYTIDGMSFEMIYTIEENKLYWGIDEAHLETFSAK